MPSEFKLNYRITEVKTLTVSGSASPESMRGGAVHQPDQLVDVVSFEWTHEDGFPPDTREEVIESRGVETFLHCLLMRAGDRGKVTPEVANSLVALAKDIIAERTRQDGLCLITVEVGTRETIKDQITVRHGSSKSVQMQAIEEKRERLAKALGIAP